MTEFIEHNKATVLLSAALGIILSLVVLIWTINNDRIGKLEKWRQEMESHADVPLTKQRLEQLERDVKRLEQEVHQLQK